MHLASSWCRRRAPDLMILTSLLLLSPTLSPLAPPQEAERKVVIRRQVVESGKAKPHLERVDQACEHAEHQAQIETARIELEVMEEVLAEMEALEAALIELEGKKLVLELAAIERQLADEQLHFERMHLEDGQHHLIQNPGGDRDTATIMIAYGNGDTEVLEWEGSRAEIHEEVISYLGDRQDRLLEESERFEYLVLAEFDEPCSEAAEECCGGCDEAYDSDASSFCEDAWEEEVILEAVSGLAQPDANVFFFDEQGDMSASSDLERRVDELDMRLDRIEAMLGELLERR